MARLCFLEGKFKLKAIGDCHFTKRSVLKNELINIPNRFLKYRSADLKYEETNKSSEITQSMMNWYYLLCLVWSWW